MQILFLSKLFLYKYIKSQRVLIKTKSSKKKLIMMVIVVTSIASAFNSLFDHILWNCFSVIGQA